MTREGTRRTYPPDNAANVTEPGGFKARRTRNDDGTYTLTMGKPKEAGYGTMTYSRQRAPGSNFEYARRQETMRGGNYGYDPQASQVFQRVGPDIYLGGGLLFKGNEADARIFLAEVARRKLHDSDPPVANNGAFLRYQARQGGQLGLQQDQLRQQLMLGLMGHDLQADQNTVKRAKALAEMQAAALEMQSQQAQLGLQQGVMDAFANGTPEEQERMTRLYQALYGKGKTSDKAKRSPWRYVPGKGDDEGAAAGMLVNQETGETRVVDGMTPAQQYYYGTLYQTLSKEMRDSIEGMPALARNAVIERMYREALANQEKKK